MREMGEDVRAVAKLDGGREDDILVFDGSAGHVAFHEEKVSDPAGGIGA